MNRKSLLTRAGGFVLAASLLGPALASAPAASASVTHPANPACCKGGGSSSTGRSTSTGSTSRTSNNTSTNRNSNTSTNRNNNTSTNRNSNTSNNSGLSGGGTKPVARTPMSNGSLVSGGKSTVIANSPASKGTLSSTVVTRSTRVTSGSSYRVAGVTYAYHPASYYSGYRMPLRYTAAWYLLLNDPFYGPNYYNPLSPWHSHLYPVGYTMVNGQLVAVHHTPWALIGIIFGSIVALVLLLVVIAAVRSNRPAPRRPSSAF